ncbi:MAG TPA: cation:dicarboxylase symporter family transporter, partial [Candidatus Hydrogenedentes bacterium]|nr:cation:dicarboxylase symporter family transporter [Candidatus Hydrogenedentota bacterium]
SSSSATLPLTIHCANRRLGADRSVCEFMLPVGATVNMDGTALYQAVAVMFLAFAQGLQPTLAQQVAVFVGAVLVSIGTAGIPGGSIALMPITLGLLGIGPEAIGLIIGVDRLLDMSRTVVNITGDVAGCVVVARSEGKLTDAPETGDRDT